jgi:hypothetical protein
MGAGIPDLAPLEPTSSRSVDHIVVVATLARCWAALSITAAMPVRVEVTVNYTREVTHVGDSEHTGH